MFYRPNDLPDYKKTIEIFRETAKQYNIEPPYLIASNSHTQNLEGFDHILNFEPQLGILSNAFNDSPSLKKLFQNLKVGIFSPFLKVYDYAKVKKLMAERRFKYKFLPCVFVGWDNTARRGKNGIIIKDRSVQIFKDSLENAKLIVKDYPFDEQLIFINAWNEWGEGNHLEPDRKFGHQFLNAVKEVFNEQ